MKYENTETSTINRVFRKYKLNANKRNLPFLLTLEEFKSIASQKCFYCDREPRFIALSPSSKRGAYLNGVDRYDNNQGYSLQNSRPCCFSCNSLKGTLHGDDFIIKVKLIVEVLHGRNTTEVDHTIRKEV